MTRSELEHIIRASGAIAQDNELIIIGSQSILAQFPEAPATLRVSMEADLYPKNKPELADVVIGPIRYGDEGGRIGSVRGTKLNSKPEDDRQVFLYSDAPFVAPIPTEMTTHGFY